MPKIYRYFVLSLVVFFFCWSVISPFVAQAAENITDTMVITATVPDNIPPSTPILIAPANGSYVTTAKPSFVWKASTDDVGMSHYQMSLDGSVLFSNIPLTATDNSSYTLTYNSTNQQYTLVPKTALTNGTHTWKIRAVDVGGKGTDSATWSFTIDTLAPTFVITQFGGQVVSISAQDLLTVPSEPIILSDNEPLLSGTGEANSSVTALLTIPGDPSQNFAFSVSAGGTWSLQLGILPRDVEMQLDFTITDTAGNISVLNDVPFLIESDTIIFPPASPSPTPSPAASPTPGVTPEPTPPSTPDPSPIISIPVIPPKEIANEVVQEAIERLPAPVTNVIRSLPEPVRKQVENTVKTVAPVSAVVVASAVPVATSFALATQFGGNLSLNLFLRLLQALGLLPAGKPQGIVFNSETYEPIPFALLTIKNESPDRVPVLETVVTDVEGIYRGIKLPPDTYRLSASHQEFRFPTTKQRPAYLDLRDFYRGEPFTVASNDQEQLFLIPMDPLEQGKQASRAHRLRLALARLVRLTSALLIPIWFISGVLSVIFPTIWNWLVFGFYTLMVAQRFWGWFRIPRITGVVVDEQGNPIPHAVIRVRQAEANELISVLSTNAQGEFKLFVPADKYQVSVTHQNYIWVEGGSTLSFNEIDARTERPHLVMTLKPTSDIYEELFGESSDS